MQGTPSLDARPSHHTPAGRYNETSEAGAAAAPKLKIRFGGSGKSQGQGQGRKDGAAGDEAAQSNVVNNHPATPAATPSSYASNGFGNGSHVGDHLSMPATTTREDDQQLQQRMKEEEERAQSLRRQEELQQNLAELPQIARQHLVPLYEIVQRVIARSYTELQSLVEVLPGQTDADRKRSIIEYVISTRRQIVKLLVLLRWSKDNTNETERCINLIAFLQRQNYQLERAVNDLKNVREMLSGARVRNYDLATAVDVLSSGNYTRLPEVFKDSFIPPPKLTASDVLVLLQDLESVIRYRLQLYEHVPIQLLQRTYRLYDGRVTFVSPGLFKASFTLGGEAMTDQWYLVDFSFDIEGRDVQRNPSGLMREHIMQVCNELLAKCAAEEKEAEEAETTDPKDVDVEASAITPRRRQRRSHAFVKVYELLQDLCLNYQLELMHYHAIQTNSTPTIWQNRLAVSLSKDRTSLEIRYLRPDKQRETHQNQPQYTYEESLTISIPSTSPSPASATKAASSAIMASRTSRLSSLAQRLASVALPPSITQPETAITAPAQPTALPMKQISATYLHQPIYIDAKGKKVTPPAHLKLNMTSRERQLDVFEPFNARDERPKQMRDLERVFGECFSSTVGSKP